jgi:hypothetical protein
MAGVASPSAVGPAVVSTFVISRGSSRSHVSVTWILSPTHWVARFLA